MKYYELMILKYATDQSYLETAKAYYAIFDTPSVQTAETVSTGRAQPGVGVPSDSTRCRNLYSFHTPR